MLLIASFLLVRITFARRIYFLLLDAFSVVKLRFRVFTLRSGLHLISKLSLIFGTKKTPPRVELLLTLSSFSFFTLHFVPFFFS